MDQINLTTLNRQRGQIKSKSGRLLKALDAFSPSKSEEDEIILNQRLRSVEELKQQLLELQGRYVQLPEETDLGDALALIDEMDDQLDHLEVRIHILLCNTKPKVQEQSRTVSSGTVNYKLPELPLPQFWGKAENFETFKSQFKAIVGTRAELTEHQKLSYLKASLHGDAKLLESPQDTFDTLMEALNKRFENKRAVIDAHINCILKFEQLNGSPNQLRQLVDYTNKSLRSLKSLNYVRNSFTDVLILNVLEQKLDRESRKVFEMSLKDTEVPTLDSFLSYLEERARILESTKNALASQPKNTPTSPSFRRREKTLLTKTKPVNPCPAGCKETHPLYRCNRFKSLSVPQRKQLVARSRLCEKCLNPHPASKCNGQGSCFVCRDASHNTLLHSETSRDSNRERGDENPNAAAALFTSGRNYTLINTAVIYLTDSGGEKRPFRAILDCGSQVSLCTVETANVLGLRGERVNTLISGINSNESVVSKWAINAKFSDRYEYFNFETNLFTVPKITEFMPSRYLNISQLRIPPDIQLADPNFSTPGKIDILLGAELFFEFLKPHRIRVPDSKLILQESVFGYLVSGSAELAGANLRDSNLCLLSTNLDTLNKTLCKFWEIENVNENELVESPELTYCNQHFLETHSRKSDGRYVVKLPFKPDMDPNLLGESKLIASKRLNQMWNRLERDPVMKSLYTDFLVNYESLDHMENITNNEENHQSGYFLPHHGVLRPGNTTTKLRVVFNASAKSSNGKSLNDLLCKGGIIQDDLFSLILRFRKHAYAFTADIEKMFRQIEVHPSERNFQKIVWKNAKDEPIQIYRLKTVTYGTACAPYLATRTLKQLASDEAKNFPLASKVLCEDFYMDDCLSGADNLQKFTELGRQLTELLSRGGMNLHKWCSNVNPAKEHLFPFDLQNEGTVKTLGMLWNCSSDTFTYNVSTNKSTIFLTKRDILSQIASIFDPLGLLGPIITRAKIFMQQLWQLKVDWSEQLPLDVIKEWQDFTANLCLIKEIKIPRCVLRSNPTYIVLHGFADASLKAYGAAIYLTVFNDALTSHSELLCSKSRVAPLKSLTIPRLELSACLLLSQLTDKVIKALKLKIDRVQLWSDSTIALAWIQTSPHLLKTFVSNRVAQIQRLTDGRSWGHIASEKNPADLVSRGLDTSSLLSNSLWWNGPDLLNYHPETLPKEPSPPAEVNNLEDFYVEVKPNDTVLLTETHEFIETFIDISSDFLTLTRVLAYMYRFVHNCSKGSERVKGPLSTEEVRAARDVLIRHYQVKYFSSEISALKKGSSVSTSSKLRFLNPFLDTTGLLRVGGRLSNSELTYDQRHPIILPDCRLTTVIFQYLHEDNLHIGPQSLLHFVRLTYWPLNGRNIARKSVHKCVTCFKSKPITMKQLMGDLPTERVRAYAPFTNTGVDFCGPFHIKYKNQRKGHHHKVFMALFICMSTKAVHLEVVTDLTTSAFIASLRRFFARRGKSSIMFSDNGTNFVGACKELGRLLKASESDNEFSKFLSSEEITWKFLPPCSPSFGGLWERGVQSFKYHFKRVVGSSVLTFEEFLTISIQIEGILNSRPLSPLSADFDNFEVLTPGHFLIGKPIIGLPEPNLLDVRDNLLNRWERRQKMVQQIWKNWSNSYLSHLQQRTKWYFMKNNINVGTMVLLKEPNLPPLKWSIGRISEVLPGKDGLVRVVKVKTSRGEYKRSISNICILPISKDESN